MISFGIIFDSNHKIQSLHWINFFMSAVSLIFPIFFRMANLHLLGNDYHKGNTIAVQLNPTVFL